MLKSRKLIIYWTHYGQNILHEILFHVPTKLKHINKIQVGVLYRTVYHKMILKLLGIGILTKTPFLLMILSYTGIPKQNKRH